MVLACAGAISDLLAAEAIAPLQPTAAIPVIGSFHGKSSEDAARDISGIACLEVAGQEKRCLVINDENRSAQFVTLAEGKLVVGNEISLIDTSAPADATGTPPADHGCTGGTKKFKDLDGEAVAAFGTDFLVVGSHGCSRKDVEFRSSSFLLIRVSVANPAHPVVTGRTYRLSDVLRQAPDIGAYFAKPLADGGLNIEGLAVAGGTLLVGLRAPSSDGKAFIVSVPPDLLFAAKAPSVMRLPLGQGAGIRDLTMLPAADGRGLVLAGPTLEQSDVPYSLFVFDPQTGASSLLATLADVTVEGQRGKAEAVTVLDMEGSQLRVLVMFDSVPNGGPLEYRMTLPKP
ncbi:DUF3616 domain-containing protein [Oleomonas cavernae]|uniref:DUF3616 domain-containing protein n=2 Tax=Oleomonas cavernae TaxID=2320859 RepID=A0A418WIV2_9PROT|nr:DUF3616 domain-containing protein [Oleomonas cavernae]